MWSQLLLEFEKVMAFVKRDMRSVATYKLNLTLSLLNTLMAAMVWSLLGQNVQLSSSLARYGGSFISYLIIGVAFNEYMIESLKAAQKSIKPTTLEDVLTAPVRLRVFLLGNVLWGYIWHSINVIVYFSIGILLFGMTLASVDLIGTILVLTLGIVVMFSFSLIASGFLFITKQGDVVRWLLTLLAEMFAGVYFPVTILPIQLQTISWILPQTYFFELIRLSLSGHQLLIVQVRFTSMVALIPLAFSTFAFGALIVALFLKRKKHESRRKKFVFPSVLVGATIYSILLLSLTATLEVSIHQILLGLIVYTLLMLPLGYMAFRRGLDIAKKRGSLSHM